jgi:hypothetical protein
MMEDQINFVAGRYRCVAVRCDRPWGHGLQLSVYDGRNDDRLNTIQFACHPEFAGYDQLQELSTEQLISLAKAQLESGSLDESMAKARANGFGLIVRFEAPTS